MPILQISHICKIVGIQMMGSSFHRRRNYKNPRLETTFFTVLIQLITNIQENKFPAYPQNQNHTPSNNNSDKL